jgi:hypothetical protein
MKEMKAGKAHLKEEKRWSRIPEKEMQAEMETNQGKTMAKLDVHHEK